MRIPSTWACAAGTAGTCGDVGTNYFAGTLDELLIYGRALSDYEIANLVAYGQATWNAATVAGGTWSYDVPEGSDGIEGLYQIDVRGTDALGNVTPLGGQRLWRGEIDTRPPAVTFSATFDDSGAISSTQYECQATDYNLDEDNSCISSGDIPIYRTSDLTLTTYSQVDEWYAVTISETARLRHGRRARLLQGRPRAV